MKWETKNKINNISQLNQTRQKNKELKNKPIEKVIQEESIETTFDYDKFIKFYESKINIKLTSGQIGMLKRVLKDYIVINMPMHIGYKELLRFLYRIDIIKREE